MKLYYLKNFLSVIGATALIALIISIFYVPLEYKDIYLKTILLTFIYGIGLGCLIPYLHIKYEDNPKIPLIGSSLIGLVIMSLTVYFYFINASLFSILRFIIIWLIIFFVIYYIEYLIAKKNVNYINELLK